MDLRQAAWAVAKKHRHGLPQVRLLKLLWLAELKHYEATGQRLTSARWYKWDHGPYSKDVIVTLKQDTDHFLVEEMLTESGRPMSLVRAAREPGVPPTSEELRSLEDTLWLYERFTTPEILYDVYGDPFFDATKFSDDFDFTRLPEIRAMEVSEADAARLRAQHTSPFESVAELFAD